ncbi:MAG TPA: STAS domain-containing protein [Terriglobales bacterium]|nr:STAS domain-containing protein [Terriglobales bacterium]
MFRATQERNGQVVTLRIEGRLSGPCLSELDQCWSEIVAGNGCRKVIVDLKEVTFVSSQGKQLLQKLCRAGAELRGDGLMTGALVEQILNSVGQVEKHT